MAFLKSTRTKKNRKSINMTDCYLKKIKIEDTSHLFVCKGHSRIVSSEKLKKSFLFKRQPYANFYITDGLLLKVCYGRSMPKDILRKYTFKSQAEREFKSADILSGLGLLTPRSYFSAFSLFPFTRGWVESMHEMDFLDGFEDLDKHFVHRKDSLEIIRCFARDLAIMTNEMLCPKDLGLGNVMYWTAQAKLAWLDTDLKKFTDKKKLSCQLMAHLQPRFLRYLSPRQAGLFRSVFSERSTLLSQ